jgi:glyceraldehyde-3-phosphate dehydrogenase (NADP+)
MFVREDEIPEQYAIKEEVHQREYLCNGEMKPWNGKVQEVYSPICIRTENGLQRKLIGTYPVCTEKEAFEALDMAVAAYDNGRGQWPTMGVADRIKCIEKFIGKMREQKDIVVKLIMWEIGKSYSDSVKEFDRTVEYIYATIDALKRHRPRFIAFYDRTGDRSADPPFAIGRCIVYGAVQLSVK